MEPLNQTQLFSLIEGMGKSGGPYTSDTSPASQIIPFSSWDAAENPSFFEGKTIEQIRDFRMGIVAFKAAFPHILPRVQPLIEKTDDLIRSMNPDVVSRAETSKMESSVIPQSSSKDQNTERRTHIQAHVARQMERANAYAAYQGKSFIPAIEQGTNRVMKKEEYLRKPAMILSGESFEMTLNYHLAETEVAQRINGAFEKAQKQGKVFQQDAETALINSATHFEGRCFEILSDALMSAPQ